jgi:hypothetical protein
VLERLALDSGGRYHRSSASNAEIDDLARTLSALSRGELGSELHLRSEERFQWPLALGWLALLAETMLGDRRRASAAAPGSRREAA